MKVQAYESTSVDNCHIQVICGDSTNAANSFVGRIAESLTALYDDVRVAVVLLNLYQILQISNCALLITVVPSHLIF